MTERIEKMSRYISATIHRLWVCVFVFYLYGPVFSLSETPQRGEEVDVSALDELSLHVTKLLLSLSTP